MSASPRLSTRSQAKRKLPKRVTQKIYDMKWDIKIGKGKVRAGWASRKTWKESGSKRSWYAGYLNYNGVTKEVNLLGFQVGIKTSKPFTRYENI